MHNNRLCLELHYKFAWNVPFRQPAPDAAVMADGNDYNGGGDGADNYFYRRKIRETLLPPIFLYSPAKICKIQITSNIVENSLQMTIYANDSAE